MSYAARLSAFAVAALAALALALAPLAAASSQTLRGSKASVELMYTSAHSHDLAFLRTQDDIYAAAESGALELVSITEDLTLDKVSFPFVLPNTHRFADSLAQAYHAGCGERLEVTSGSRPIDEQPRNASPKSVHPTGMAVDFHRPGGKCLTWLRTALIGLEARGVVEATEEKHPAHFHVAVLHQLREPPIRTLASAVASAASAASTAAGTIARTRSAAGEVALPVRSAKAASYKVRVGDNLWTIAERKNTTSARLKRLNHLKTTRLQVGQVLKLR